MEPERRCKSGMDGGLRGAVPISPLLHLKTDGFLSNRWGPLQSNIFLHEVDRQWCRSDGVALGNVRLVRYADDMVLLARTEQGARQAWEQLQAQFAALRLIVNHEKSEVTTLAGGFAFLGFEFRKAPGR